MSVNKIYNIQEWQQIVTAVTPSASASIIYPKTDGKWYYMNNDGVEKITSLSYNVGNGLTSSTASGLYNFNLSVNIDGSSLTFSNSKISVGYLTSSVFSQFGPATASYILSVNSSGNPIWIPNISGGINGTAGWIAKFNDVNSLTNSNIYENTVSVPSYISMFTSSISAAKAKLFVNGSIDASIYYINSNLTSNISITTTNPASGNILQITTPNFVITDPNSINLISGSGSSTIGNTLNLLNVVTVKATASNNATSSVILPSVKLIGIGTASPSHLFTIFATQSAFRLVDGSQGANKYLVSDANGVATWQSLVISGSVSLNLATASGLTVSNYVYSILLSPNSGLTLSNSGLAINPSAAGYGLTFSNGSFSFVGNISINTGNGLTYSGNTYSINLGLNSGLTFSGSSVVLQLGSGLNIVNGALASSGATIQNGITNSIPYYDTTTTLGNSVMTQIGTNILIGTTSNIGAKLYIAGSFSSTGNAIINSINIGRGVGTTNLIFGNTRLATYGTPGSYNIAIGDNSLNLNSVGSNNNIAIGLTALSNLTSGNNNIAIGNYAAINSNSRDSVAIGYNVASNLGNESVAIGASAGKAGNQNISIGYYSGASVLSSYNVFLGYRSGISFLGSYSIFIGGYDSNVSTSNNIFISDGAGNLRIYSPASGNVLVGTTSETGSKLVINGSASFFGNLQIIDGTQNAGKILISDTNGNTTWFMPIGLGMTISGYTFSINLQSNSGLMVDMTGLAVNSNIANTGLLYSAGSMSVNPNIAGYGLTFGGGSMSFTTNINALEGYLPYFNTITSLTSSVVYQTASNILIGTTSNIGAKLVVNGSASFYGGLRIADSTYGINRVLTSDSQGYATWQSLTASGGSLKYSTTQAFSANTPVTITHNLNTMFYIIQLFDYNTGEEIMGGYSSRTPTQVTITLNASVANCGIVIIG